MLRAAASSDSFAAPCRCQDFSRQLNTRCVTDHGPYAAEGDDVTTSPGSATVAYQGLTAAVRGDLIMPRDPGHDDAPPPAGQPETGRRRWAVLAVVPAAQFLTILDPWVVNIALPVLQHDFCPGGAAGRLADPRCVRRPTRRATAVRGAGDPTARQDRGCRDVPKPGSSLRTAGSSRSCDRGWHRICRWLVGVTGRAASCSPATWPYRRQPIRGPDVRLEQAPAAACPGSRGGCRRLAAHLQRSRERSGAPLVLLAIAAGGISANAGGAMPRQRILAAIFRAIAGASWRDGTFPRAVPAQRGHPVRSPRTNANGC